MTDNIELVVVDKSWLIGINEQELKKIVRDKFLLFTSTLGYELFTSEEKNKSKNAIKKLFSIKDSVKLIEPIGSLIKDEITNNTSCLPLSSKLLDFDEHFFKYVIEKNFEFQGSDKNHLQAFYDHYEVTGLNYFREGCLYIETLFTDLKDKKPGGNHKNYSTYFNSISKEEKLILSVYDDIYKINLDLPKIINSNWVLFKWLQIHLMSEIEFIRKYGSHNNNQLAKKMINDNIDLDYCIYALLTKLLATRDKTMKFYFKLCCPQGRII
jgi:hypothetical protein